jgi:hypothetical protein
MQSGTSRSSKIYDGRRDGAVVVRARLEEAQVLDLRWAVGGVIISIVGTALRKNG